MKRKFCSLSLSLSFALISVPVSAGVADSPLPELVPGETTYHVFTVPGVIEHIGLRAFFACTSLETTATIQVGVEIFATFGGDPINDAAATSLSMGPGTTRTFATGNAIGISVDSVVGSIGGISQGSARILATSKKIACTAFLADQSNAPPTSMTYLTIIAKTKQKAAN